MSMARIAKMSNVSTKTLYNIFVNRELLLLESASERLEELLLSNTIQLEEHGIPRFLAITAIAMKPFIDNPDYMKVVVSIIVSATDDVRGSEVRMGRVQGFAHDALLIARQNCELRPATDIHELSLILAANQWGVALLWQQNLLSLDQLIKQSNLNNVITLLPFCIGHRRDWLEERLDTLSQETSPNQKESIRL